MLAQDCPINLPKTFVSNTLSTLTLTRGENKLSLEIVCGQN